MVPAYSRALHQVRGVVHRKSEFIKFLFCQIFIKDTFNFHCKFPQPFLFPYSPTVLLGLQFYKSLRRRHCVGGGAALAAKNSDDLFLVVDQKLATKMYTAKMPSAARRQIIGGGAPINKSRRGWRRALQFYTFC